MSKESDKQYTALYKEIFNINTSEQAHNALLKFSEAVKSAGGNLQSVLKDCHETTGKQLELVHLSHTIYTKGHNDIIVSGIKSGAVNTKSTIWHMKAPEEKADLHFYAEQNGAHDIAKALDDYSANNKQYTALYKEIFNINTSEQAHNALLKFSEAVKSAGGNLQSVLKDCHETTGKQLELVHLSHTIYTKGHNDIIVSGIKSGAINTKSTIWHMKAPEEKADLHFYVEQNGAHDIAKALDDYSANNKQYTALYKEIFNINTSEQAHNALLKFSEAVKSAGGNLQSVLKDCHETTGKQLELVHLSHTIYTKGHNDIIVSGIKSGAVNTKSTIWHMKAPEEKADLHFYVDQNGAHDIAKALDDYSIKMTGELYVSEE